MLSLLPFTYITTSMEKKYSTILMDLDGTVTDPGEGITRSVAYALESLGIRVADRKALYPFIGPPLQESFRDFYSLNDRQTAEAIRAYRAYFSTQGIFENEVYPGMEAFLQKQTAAGRRIYLATSKPEPFASRILAHFHLSPYFAGIAGSTLDGKRAEKGEVIRYLLDTFPIATDELPVMIGDRKYDVEGAHQHGLPAIGVLYGYGSREELEKAGADYLARDLAELDRLLAG